MAPKPGKHTPYFELVDAQAKAGCPICRLVFKATDRYLDSILYEAVLDPDVRAKLKQSRGFCPKHVEMLHNKPGRSLGIALIYRDVIRDVAAKTAKSQVSDDTKPLRRLWRRHGLHRPSSHGRPDDRSHGRGGGCLACRIEREAEANFIELLLAHIDDEKLFAAYAQGEGLCLYHLHMAIDATPDEETLQRVIEPQSERYERMMIDLDEFIRKSDHRFQHEEGGEEGDVWLRAMNAIVGGPGMGLSAKSGGRRAQDLKERR